MLLAGLQSFPWLRIISNDSEEVLSILQREHSQLCNVIPRHWKKPKTKGGWGESFLPSDQLTSCTSRFDYPYLFLHNDKCYDCTEATGLPKKRKKIQPQHLPPGLPVAVNSLDWPHTVWKAVSFDLFVYQLLTPSGARSPCSYIRERGKKKSRFDSQAQRVGLGSPRERGLGEEGTGGLGGAEGKCYKQDGQTAGPTAQPRERHPASCGKRQWERMRELSYIYVRNWISSLYSRN